ncbi:MAG: serine hydrolase [Lachnospiraceae bacterium]
MSPFLKDKRKRCRTGALLLLAGSVLAGTVPNTGELPKIPVGGLTVSAQELDIESIEAMQGGGATGAGQNAETVDGQGTSANSDTLAGYGKPSDNGQSADGTLAGDGQNPDDTLAGDGQNADTSAQSESSFTDEKLTSVLAQIQASLPASNGDWAVYVCDLKTGSEGSINDHRMQAASLIKLYIMGTVYENYDALIAQYGQDTIDANLYSMITVSDNDAANALTSYLGSGDSSAGMQIVNNYCLAHGYTTSSMGRLLLHSNEFGDNYTSVENCGKLLKMVYWDGYLQKTPENRGTDEKTTESDLQSEQVTENIASTEDDTDEITTENTTALTPHASDMFALLCAQTRRHKIPAQLPDGVRTASKTGELDDVENDAAILYDTDNDLIIVFMSEHLSDCGAAQSTIASLSRQIYDAYH